MGRRDVGQERKLHRPRSLRRSRTEAARHSASRDVLRIQRRADQPLCAVPAAPLQEADSRRVSRRGDEPDWRLVHVEVGAVHECVPRYRRQAHGIGVGRNALGRRHVDQQLRHGEIRAAVAEERQVGRPADRVARLREDGHDAEPARSRLRIPLVAQHEAGAMARVAGRRVQRERLGRQHHFHFTKPRSRRGLALERDSRTRDSDASSPPSRAESPIE